MKIQKKISQHRRDFVADMVCELCGHVDKKVIGYDDANFHQNDGYVVEYCAEAK